MHIIAAIIIDISDVDARQTISWLSSVSFLALNISESKTDTAESNVAIKNINVSFWEEILFLRRVQYINKKNRIVGKNNILDFNVNFAHISEAMRHIKVIIPKQDDIVWIGFFIRLNTGAKHRIAAGYIEEKSRKYRRYIFFSIVISF